MNEIEIVIKIPKKYIDDMEKEEFINVDDLCNRILNGTVLPKGHGRLIDADELKKYKYHDENRYENAVAIAQVDWMPTIIEADKEVENETISEN